MRCVVAAAGFALVVVLAGCSTTSAPEPEIRYKEVPVAVAAGCVVARPAEIAPLRDRVAPDQWAARAPGAKAATVEAQAGERLNYEDRLRAATSGCKDAPGR